MNQFKPQDLVKLSQLGRSCFNQKKQVSREGVVASVYGDMVNVRWTGRKTLDYLHHDYLQRVIEAIDD